MTNKENQLAESAARRAYFCSVGFICAVLLFNAVSYFVAFFITEYGKLSLVSPMAISSYLDILIVAAFFFGVNPFSFLRFKAVAAAGFFAYCQYSLTGTIDNYCVAQLALGAGLGLLSVKLPAFLTIPIGLLTLAVSGYINVNTFLK